MIYFIHSIDFYQNIVQGLAFSLNHDVFPMYINPISNQMMGSYNSIAMPHILLYIPAFLLNMTNDIFLSFNIFFFVLNFLQVLCMFICLNAITKKWIASLVCSLLYVSVFLLTLNQSMILGLSEHIAITFAPLVMYGFYNLYFGDGKKKVFLLIGLFLLAVSNLTMTLITVVFVVFFAIIFFIKSLIKLKIFYIIFTIISLVTLTAFIYVPMGHYYYLKQYSIIDIIGNNNIIILSFLMILVLFIYILLMKSIIKKLENKILRVGFAFVIILLFGFSIFIALNLNIKNENNKKLFETHYIENKFIPNPTEEYFKTNETRLKELYQNCGVMPFDVRITDYGSSYIFMNAGYQTSNNFEKFVMDFPFYNFIGMRAYDDRDNVLPIEYGMDNNCQVIVSKGTGRVKIGFEPPLMWTFALMFSIFWFVLLVTIRIIKEFLTHKKMRKEAFKAENKSFSIDNIEDNDLNVEGATEKNTIVVSNEVQDENIVENNIEESN